MEIVLLVTGVLVGAALGWSLATQRAAARVRTADVRVAEARAGLDAERRLGAERVAALQADHRRYSDQFRSLAAEALAANNEQFLGLAEQRLRATSQQHESTLAQREQAVRSVVEPLSRVLDQVRAEVTSAEQARASSNAALGAQLRAMHEVSELLRQETGQLVTALRSSQVRGRWGELQLRRVVEAAGMVDQVDFVEQASARTDDGVQRPDMVVRLAGGKQVVLDAKVAFLGYLEAVQATEEQVRRERMAAHARHLRRHVDDLASKRYWEQFDPAPEFVVMFVPAEAFLHAALEVDPGLQEYAMERHVVLATPMTLVALLRTVGYAWRQEALAANAQQVLSLGRELHARLSTLGGHVGKVGRQLDGAVRAYNEAVSSLESRVLVSARRLTELRVTDEELPAPAQIDRAARRPQAPELEVVADL
ncbi:DNA recombination protein RmuC [Cellulomonas bogoriensis]|uniref:Recombinase RmuC n=1 Tax=Cellulomonas bogoriensis 69B4 = DSM 16987 TaxID=1386082 RepID=A0A0A0C143_9CELL|nr:DNA recombination protein RmuC [Cellulomonas bogoriensis]KGM13900.1 recombinase RmuC [Cellulomonas bogoriensis 69B4 = DSM 16987]